MASELVLSNDGYLKTTLHYKKTYNTILTEYYYFNINSLNRYLIYIIL